MRVWYYGDSILEKMYTNNEIRIIIEYLTLYLNSVI